MRKLFILISLMATLVTYSQEPFPENPSTCGTDEFIKNLIRNNPEIKEKMDRMNRDVSEYYITNSRTLPTLLSSKVTIPVVVYIVHKNGVENITSTQVLSQINKLNEYFGSYGVQFCLATMNNTTALPGASPNPGIIRIFNTSLTDLNVDTENAALKATSTLPSNRFLKIWVVNSINNGGAAGFSALPEFVPSSLDGIVMDYKAFGDNTTCGCTTLNSSTQKGKILVHEVGHYLGLYHTFENGCSGMSDSNCNSQGDMVCDTPPVQNANAGCTVINSCGESINNANLPDDINNYMDYTNETCLNHFSSGQVLRMKAMTTMYRSLLISSANMTYTGVLCNGGLLASFTTNNNTSCVGNSVTFSAAPIIGVTSYNWDFGDGTTGSGQNVNHTFTSALNPAIITLTISNGTDSASTIQSYYIENCTPINNTESNWYFYNKNALSFSTGIPVYDNSAFTNNSFSSADGLTNECSAVQSDINGNLLFYTDGASVWNKNHLKIANNILKGSFSSLNGTLIVPNPANNNQYYIFTTDDVNLSNNGFNYTKVQVDGSNNATIVVGQINIPIIVPINGYNVSTSGTGAIIANEAITAVAHSNGYWIIASAIKNNNSQYFIVYNLTSTGLTFVRESFVENLGFTVSNSSARFCNIQVSPNAKKIIFLQISPNKYILDFDNCNGSFSNQKLLTTLNFYGAEFSPDSKLLYTSGTDGKLIQYDLESCPIQSTIITDITGSFSGMQRGPNNKIYVNTFNSPQIVVINSPNNLCTISNSNACNYSYNGPVMQNSTNLGSGLPNMIDAKTPPVFSNTILSSEAKCATTCYAYNFEADICTTTYNWDFGDPTSGSTNNTSSIRTPSHVFTGAGTYTVTCTTSSGTLTTTVTVGSLPIITGPNLICLQNGGLGNYTISIPNGYSAQWSVSGGTISGLSNQPSVLINWGTSGGTISVELKNNFNNCISINTKTITSFCSCDCVPYISGSTQYDLDNTCMIPVTYPSNSVCNNYNAYFSYDLSTPITTRLVACNIPYNLIIKDVSGNVICTKTLTYLDPNSPPTSGNKSIYNSEKNLKLHDILIAPNPVNKTLEIKIANYSGDLTIQVVDLNGRIIKEVKTADFNSETTLDLNQVQTGVYLVKVKGTDINFTKKIIKN